MKMVRVSSKAIQAVGYDEHSRRMKITFVHGSTYDFCRVPPDIFRRLLDSPSKGAFYNAHIKDRYPC